MHFEEVHDAEQSICVYLCNILNPLDIDEHAAGWLTRPRTIAILPSTFHYLHFMSRREVQDQFGAGDHPNDPNGGIQGKHWAIVKDVMRRVFGR